MSVASELHSPVKPGSEARKILGPGGNRIRVLEEARKKKDALKNKKQPRKINAPAATPIDKLVSESTKEPVVTNGSRDSSSDSSSCNGTGVKCGSLKKKVKNSSVKAGKVVPEEAETLALSPTVPGLVKRCDWITLNSEPVYTSFHDEEWGVPVKDEIKLFELLILSLALAELTWPSILSKRDIFRRLFENFDPSCLANIDEKKLLQMKTNGSLLLSEPKLRAIVQNSKQVLKIQQEFGSFSNYCWRFVNHRPIRNAFRYPRQVPAKTPKSELVSKDMMQRGFQCVGPTVIYSFMQVAGMVNDHLVSCVRYNECNNYFQENFKAKTEKTCLTVDALDGTCTSHVQ